MAPFRDIARTSVTLYSCCRRLFFSRSSCFCVPPDGDLQSLMFCSRTHVSDGLSCSRHLARKRLGQPSGFLCLLAVWRLLFLRVAPWSCTLVLLCPYLSEHQSRLSAQMVQPGPAVLHRTCSSINLISLELIVLITVFFP